MLNLVTAIPAVKVGINLRTYANILLRPYHNLWSKSQPLRLSNGEVQRLIQILGDRGWGWALRDDTSQIYCRYMPEEVIKQTSVSGMYSGANKNQFNVLEYYGRNWLRVETLKVGSGWHTKPIRADLLHWVYTFKGYNPPCGPVQIPLLSYAGSAWIQKWQVGL